MGLVTADIAVSLDPVGSGHDQSLEHPFGPHGGHRLHTWMFEHGDESADEVATSLGAGAYIMGRNMFGPDRGEWGLEWTGWWGPEPPYAAGSNGAVEHDKTHRRVCREVLRVEALRAGHPIEVGQSVDHEVDRRGPGPTIDADGAEGELGVRVEQRSRVLGEGWFHLSVLPCDRVPGLTRWSSASWVPSTRRSSRALTGRVAADPANAVHHGRAVYAASSAQQVDGDDLEHGLEGCAPALMPAAAAW